MQHAAHRREVDCAKWILQHLCPDALSGGSHVDTPERTRADGGTIWDTRDSSWESRNGAPCEVHGLVRRACTCVARRALPVARTSLISSDLVSACTGRAGRSGAREAECGARNAECGESCMYRCTRCTRRPGGSYLGNAWGNLGMASGDAERRRTHEAARIGAARNTRDASACIQRISEGRHRFTSW